MQYVIFHKAACYACEASENVAEALRQVSEAHVSIRGLGENIYKEQDLEFVEVTDGVPLYEIMYRVRDVGLSVDETTLLSQIINQSSSLVSLEGLCGVLGPHCDCDQPFHLQSLKDLSVFMRAVLTQQYCGTDRFFEKCKVAFPLLQFSNRFPRCLDTFDDGVKNFLCEVVECFSSLNDILVDTLGCQDIKSGLKAFSAASGKKTTMEGAADRHPALTFSFEKKVKVDTVTEIVKSFDVRCEPHMKIVHSNKVGDSHYYQCRVYFTPHSHAEFPLKVLIGHAGAHL